MLNNVYFNIFMFVSKRAKYMVVHSFVNLARTLVIYMKTKYFLKKVERFIEK